MNTVAIEEPMETPAREAGLVHLPLGLLGFEHVKQYRLVADPKEAPFMWLIKHDDPNHTFLVISPFEVAPDYQPNISEEDVNFLGLQRPADALLLNIVTLRNAEHATVNLKGPVVFNRHTLIGKQVIPLNAAQYTLQHPLTSSE
jgi:flagellar assembly factor FliW